jgi:NAD(P)-dependent dehydrogenase (short-subunit alcohol dehydrogenase family)
MRLDQRTVFITGGAKRIGSHLARALARRGANLVINYRYSNADAQTVVRELRQIGVDAVAVQGDVSSAADVQRMIASALERFGRIDVLINNAAVYFKTPFAQITESEWDLTMDINLKGSFLCAKAVAEHMRSRGDGKIINFADWAGMRPYPEYLPYCVSKASVIALTQALAQELAPAVQVNCIAPGPILLPEEMDEDERERVVRATPLKRIGSPEDIVQTVLFLIEGTDFATGGTYLIDGGRYIAS